MRRGDGQLEREAGHQGSSDPGEDFELCPESNSNHWMGLGRGMTRVHPYILKLGVGGGVEVKDDSGKAQGDGMGRRAVPGLT